MANSHCKHSSVIGGLQQKHLTRVQQQMGSTPCFLYLRTLRIFKGLMLTYKALESGKVLAWQQRAQHKEACSGASPLYLKHGKAQGAHAVVQAGQCKDCHQQGLTQRLHAVTETRHKLRPRSPLPAQSLTA